MFDDRTYENILKEALEAAPTGVDTRQGSIYFDAVASTCFQIARYYADLRTAFELVFITTAVDEYLDQKGAEYGIYRNPATSAKYQYEFKGTQPAVGERFFTDGKYFVLRQSNKLGLYLESEKTGSADNHILQKTLAVPVNNINKLEESIFGILIEPGADLESDEDYRQRIREKVAGPAENGNRQHYKTWCEEVTGVGRARIVPLFAGENTVLGVITGTDGAPATEAVVMRVQDYIDPFPSSGQVSYNGKVIDIGPGLGNGVANIGAHFASISAEALPIKITFKAELAQGKTIDDAEKEASAAISLHLKDLALNTTDYETVIVRLSTIGAILYSLSDIIDYTDLEFNGQSANIEVSNLQVAVLEEVKIDEIV